MGHKVTIPRIESEKRSIEHKQSKPKRLYTIGAAFVAILLLFTSLNILISATTPNIPTVIEPGSMVSGYSYVIFQSGGNTYARNGTTGAIDYSGSDAYTVIQAILNIGGGILLKDAIYTGDGTNDLAMDVEGSSIFGESRTGTILSEIGVSIRAPNCTVQSIELTGIRHLSILATAIYDGTGARIRELTILRSTHLLDAIEIRMDGRALSDIIFEDCIVNTAVGFGWYTSAAAFEKLSNVQYINCQAISCGDGTGNVWATGFAISENAPVENISLINCIADQSWESGFHIESVIAKNVRIVNCISKNNGQKPGYTFGAGFFVGTAGVSVIDSSSYGNKFGYWIENLAPGESRSIAIRSCNDEQSAEAALRVDHDEGMVTISDFVSINATKLALTMIGTGNVFIDGFLMKNTQGSPFGYCTVFGATIGTPAYNITIHNFVSTGTNGQDQVFCIGYGNNITIDGLLVDTTGLYPVIISNLQDSDISDVHIIARGNTSTIALLIQTCKRVIISNVHIVDPTSATSINRAIVSGSSVDTFVRKSTLLVEGVTTPYTNPGFDVNDGNISITGAVNSVSLDHSLYTTPTLTLVTPVQTGYGNYSATVNATQITITFSNQPGGATWYFHWYAQTW